MTPYTHRPVSLPCFCVCYPRHLLCTVLHVRRRYESGWPTPLNRNLLHTPPDALPAVVLKLQLHANLRSKQALESEDEVTPVDPSTRRKPSVLEVDSAGNLLPQVSYFAVPAIALLVELHVKRPRFLKYLRDRRLGYFDGMITGECGVQINPDVLLCKYTGPQAHCNTFCTAADAIARTRVFFNDARPESASISPP